MRMRPRFIIVRGNRLDLPRATLTRSRALRNRGPRRKGNQGFMTSHAQGTPRVATTDQIRAHFPALERQHGGAPVAYFDGPGGTQVPRAVVDAMSDYLYHHNANT